MQHASLKMMTETLEAEVNVQHQDGYYGNAGIITRRCFALLGSFSPLSSYLIFIVSQLVH